MSARDFLHDSRSARLQYLHENEHYDFLAIGYICTFQRSKILPRKLPHCNGRCSVVGLREAYDGRLQSSSDPAMNVVCLTCVKAIVDLHISSICTYLRSSICVVKNLELKTFLPAVKYPIPHPQHNCQQHILPLVALTCPNVYLLAQNFSSRYKTWTTMLLQMEHPLQSPSHHLVRAQGQTQIYVDPSKSGRQAPPTCFLPVQVAPTTASQHEKRMAENLELL